MKEEKIGQAWLAWERKQVQLGLRKTLPCDIVEKKQDELNSDHIAILKILKTFGAHNSIALAQRLNKSPAQIARLMRKLIQQRKAQKIGMTERLGPKKNGTAIWIYDVVEENDKPRPLTGTAIIVNKMLLDGLNCGEIAKNLEKNPNTIRMFKSRFQLPVEEV